MGQIFDRQLDNSAPAAAQVHTRLRERIIALDLLPGARLSETEIGQEYAVSRQPVREAFIKLAEEGLLDVRPQRGTFVTRISIRLVMDARFVREAIEADIVRLVAAAADGALIAELRTQITAQKALNGVGGRAFVSLDDLFHQTLSEAADKARVWKTLAAQKIQMDRVRQIASETFPVNRLISQHEAIVNALERGDAGVAENAMRLHLREILSDLPRIAAAEPAYFMDHGA